MTREEAVETLRANYPDACFEQLREAVDMAIEALHQTKWIPISEGLPEEHEWVGTKQFGTTISDKIIITFEVDGHRFVRVMSLQNGDLGPSEKHTMDAFYKDWRMIAWMPLPEPYKGGEGE